MSITITALQKLEPFTCEIHLSVDSSRPKTHLPVMKHQEEIFQLMYTLFAGATKVVVCGPVGRLDEKYKVPVQQRGNLIGFVGVEIHRDMQEPFYYAHEYGIGTDLRASDPYTLVQIFKSALQKCSQKMLQS